MSGKLHYAQYNVSRSKNSSYESKLTPPFKIRRQQDRVQKRGFCWENPGVFWQCICEAWERVQKSGFCWGNPGYSDKPSVRHGRECAFLSFLRIKFENCAITEKAYHAAPPALSPSTADILFSTLPRTEISGQVEPVCMMGWENWEVRELFKWSLSLLIFLCKPG